MLVHQDLRTTAASYPEKVALLEDKTHCTFAELNRRSDNLAAALQHKGVKRGDRVAIMMENSINLVVSVYGILKAGAAFTLLHPSTKPEKLSYVLSNCSARVLLTQANLQRFVRPGIADAHDLQAVIWSGKKALPGEEPGFEVLVTTGHQTPKDPGLIDKDLCAIIYTSGSTGFPKGVTLTHRNIHNTSRSIASYLGNTPRDIVLSVLPLSFDYGLYQVLTGSLIGFTVVLEKSFAFPGKVLSRLAEVKATGFPGVPTMFSRILDLAEKDASIDLSSLRYLTNTAAALPPSHIDRLQARIPDATFFSMYGLTECTRVSYLEPERLADKRGSIGKAIPNCEVYVVDDQGHRLPPGSAGELVVRGANIMSGYWRNPEATARCLRDGELLGEKVLFTGDHVYMDEEGFLYFQGRVDDLFKSRGEKIYPKEIELVLHQMDQVAHAAVFGIDDPVDGQAIVACVAAAPGERLSKAGILMHCRQHLDNYMVPRHIWIRDDLPKSENGKIDKRTLAGCFVELPKSEAREGAASLGGRV